MSCLASALADVSDHGAEEDLSRDRLTLLSEAESLAQDALATSIEVLGEEHPDSLTTMHNLASIHMSFFESLKIELVDDKRAEHARLAEETFNDALVLSRRALGKEHPETIVTLNYLAACLEERQPAQAEAYYREAREVAFRAFGEAHPLTLDLTRDLAFFLEGKLPYDAAEHDEAERLLNQALDACRTSWRSDHPATLRALNDLAWFSWYVDPDRAESLYNEAVEGARRELGVDNRRTHQYMLSCAQFLETHERHQDAALLYRELLRIAVDEETRTKALEGADRTSAVGQTCMPLGSR